MANKKSKTEGSSKSDSRLRSFLRKAAAIIAAEKGLNADSHAKIRTLADREKLPDDLFTEALTLLQDSNAKSNLSHYEKAFIKFLDCEFEKIPGDIISPRLEKEAVKHAKQKYEIGETRAQQLIVNRAQVARMELISPQEAVVFADRSIVDQIGDATKIDIPLRDQLFKFGDAWGLSESQVATTVVRQTSKNRAARRRQLLRPILVGLMLVFALAGMGYWAYSSGWFPFGTQFSDSPKTDDSSDASIPLENTTRFSDSAFLQLKRASDSNPELRVAIENVISNEESNRRDGYRQLVRLACERRDDQSATTTLIVQLFYFEPEVELSRAVAEEIRRYLDDSLADRESMQKFNVQDLRNTYQANSLLWEIWEERPKLSNSSLDQVARRLELQTCLPIEPKFDVSAAQVNGQQLVRLKQEVEIQIAKAQWNSLIQLAWSNPTQSAVILPSLYRMTKPILDVDSLKSFRDDSVATILETDISQWQTIRHEIESSIEGCEEFRLMDWVDLIESASDLKFQAAIGRLLIPRLGIATKSNRPVDIVMAITEYALKVRNKQLEPVTKRSKILDNFFSESIESNVSLSLVSPDRIAQIALAVNVELAFCEALKNASHIDESSFLEFDRLIVMPPPRLQALIALPIDNKKSHSENEGSATASDKRRLDAAIARLNDSGSDSTDRRLLALKQLKQIAHRFQGISYTEAKIIAAFLLSDLTRDELLGVEQVLDSFSHWPNLTLAIADELPKSDVKADQALTVLRILLGRHVEILQNENWKAQAKNLAIQTVAAEVASRIDLDPDNIKSNWVRLNIFLLELYRDRLADTLTNSNSAFSQSNPKLHQLIAELVKQKLRTTSLERSDAVGRTVTEARRLLQILDATSANEIEKVAWANQMHCSVLIAEFVDGSAAQLTALGLLHDLRDQSNSITRVGDRLYVSELALLKITNLRRNELVNRLLDREHKNE